MLGLGRLLSQQRAARTSAAPEVPAADAVGEAAAESSSLPEEADGVSQPVVVEAARNGHMFGVVQVSEESLMAAEEELREMLLVMTEEDLRDRHSEERAVLSDHSASFCMPSQKVICFPVKIVSDK